MSNDFRGQERPLAEVKMLYRGVALQSGMSKALRKGALAPLLTDF